MRFYNLAPPTAPDESNVLARMEFERQCLELNVRKVEAERDRRIFLAAIYSITSLLFAILFLYAFHKI
jgi:hypothetical protein